MATQGIVSVITNGSTRIKVVAGSDGNNAEILATWLRNHIGATAKEIFEHAQSIGFGSEDDLVVQYSPNEFISSGCIQSVSGLYRETFHVPDFNPRWARGTADHVEIVTE